MQVRPRRFDPAGLWPPPRVPFGCALFLKARRRPGVRGTRSCVTRQYSRRERRRHFPFLVFQTRYRAFCCGGRTGPAENAAVLHPAGARGGEKTVYKSEAGTRLSGDKSGKGVIGRPRGNTSTAAGFRQGGLITSGCRGLRDHHHHDRRRAHRRIRRHHHRRCARHRRRFRVRPAAGLH
jgi:hypothetical protein